MKTLRTGACRTWEPAGAAPAYAGAVPEPSENPQPARFSYDERGRALLIDWTDGVSQSIPFAVLRRNCPCAACAGELNFTGRFAGNPRLRAGEDELADIALVGAYGLSAVWADGHNTGIYTYARLRGLGDGQGILPGSPNSDSYVATRELPVRQTHQARSEQA